MKIDMDTLKYRVRQLIGEQRLMNMLSRNNRIVSQSPAMNSSKGDNAAASSVPNHSSAAETSAPAEVDRGTWGKPAEFILSCLGYAVGLGNVWRFPYLCFQNGGGAFLIPFIVMLIFVGLPMFLVELAIGQYRASGTMDVWAVSPIFKGVGASMVLASAFGCIYYNMLLGWSIYYLFASWREQLPWYDCANDFNTPYCYTKREAQACESSEVGNVWFNLTCYNHSFISQYDVITSNYSTDRGVNETSRGVVTSVTGMSCLNGSLDGRGCENTLLDVLKDAMSRRVSASEEYYNLKVLERSETMEDWQTIKWELALSLLGAWLLCYVCVARGIKSSGKVVYVTATFPYFVLIVLLIRGALLPGAIEGIEFYIVPQWSKLATAKVWIDAAGQVFFSLSVAQGGLMTFASYNKFYNNVYRDALIVVILDAITSIFAGFAIFSIVGYLAHSLGKPVQEVVTSGSGLAFIAYPEVVTFLWPSQLWATLFFLMLITLGIDSQFAGIETIMTVIVDAVPRLRTFKPLVSLAICAVAFILGLSMCTKAGVYWVDLISYFSNGWSLVLIALAESIAIGWVYGADKLLDIIEEMIGYRLHKYWWFCWTFISPTLLTAILLFNIISFTPLAYGHYVLPSWAQAIGWMMTIATIIMIPIFAVYETIKSYSISDYDEFSFVQRIKKLSQPTSVWKYCGNGRKIPPPEAALVPCGNLMSERKESNDDDEDKLPTSDELRDIREKPKECYELSEQNGTRDSNKNNNDVRLNMTYHTAQYPASASNFVCHL